MNTQRTLSKKSTLRYIRRVSADSGERHLNGQRVRFASPAESRRAGIEMVYQDLALAGNLSVTGNIFRGHEHTRAHWGPLRLQ